MELTNNNDAVFNAVTVYRNLITYDSQGNVQKTKQQVTAQIQYAYSINRYGLRKADDILIPDSAIVLSKSIIDYANTLANTFCKMRVFPKNKLN